MLAQSLTSSRSGSPAVTHCKSNLWWRWSFKNGFGYHSENISDDFTEV